jgi:predicted ATPase
MITEIHIDGFKSLNGFRLSLKKGLNILVGPNGSGKTNIITFFEFLSYLNQFEIHEAVSHIGGAGSIFTKTGDIGYKNSISADIYGCRVLNNKKFVRYNLSFKIEVEAEAGLIFFKEQEIKIQLVDKRTSFSKHTAKDVKWDLHINHSCEGQNDSKINILHIDRRKVKNRFHEKFTKDDIKQRIISFSKRNIGRSLLQMVGRELDVTRPVGSDMIGGEIFNIIPSKVKIPEDIAKQPGIKKDGTGLASTLYAIRNNRYHPFQKDYRYAVMHRRAKLNPRIYERIIDLTKLANDSIENIEVSNNAFDNQLMVKVTIKSKGTENIILPLSSMSDGTIKWITLITAILSSSQIFSIEEPENFLHPWMQSEIIKIMRSSFQNKLYENFALMSSHSETLLNSADPEEVIVVSMKNGITNSKRVSNLKLLREEISSTGFGLGYYYLTGAFGDE